MRAATAKPTSKNSALDEINCLTKMAVSVTAFPAEQAVQNHDAELEIQGGPVEKLNQLKLSVKRKLHQILAY